VHRHNRIEEKFYILEGSLEFFLGDQVLALHDGDFVRAPAGTKHGYENVSESLVKMLVSFLPGVSSNYFSGIGMITRDSYMRLQKTTIQGLYFPRHE
jgi:quercetin dioxygenase-like cupin family protein